MFEIDKITLNVEGMSCTHCEMTIQKGLAEIEGIKNVKADHKNKKVEIKYKGDIDIIVSKAKEKITELGYKVV